MKDNQLCPNCAEAIKTELHRDYSPFKTRYYRRLALQVAAIRAWQKLDGVQVIKSKLTASGSPCMGGGWFIVQADLPTGRTNDCYMLEDWDLFDCQETERANPIDGYLTSKAAERILEYEGAAK